MSHRPALKPSVARPVPGLRRGGQSRTHPLAPPWRARLPSEPLPPDAG